MCLQCTLVFETVSTVSHGNLLTLTFLAPTERQMVIFFFFLNQDEQQKPDKYRIRTDLT